MFVLCAVVPYFILTKSSCTSTTSCQMLMPPIETEPMFHTAKLNTVNYSISTTLNSSKSKYTQAREPSSALYLHNLSDHTRMRYLLARVQPCDTRGVDAALPQNPLVKYSRMLSPYLIHAQTIDAVIGRIRLDNSWAIIDRSRSGARTQFINDEGNDID